MSNGKLQREYEAAPLTYSPPYTDAARAPQHMGGRCATRRVGYGLGRRSVRGPGRMGGHVRRYGHQPLDRAAAWAHKAKGWNLKIGTPGPTAAPTQPHVNEGSGKWQRGQEKPTHPPSRDAQGKVRRSRDMVTLGGGAATTTGHRRGRFLTIPTY